MEWPCLSTNSLFSIVTLFFFWFVCLFACGKDCISWWKVKQGRGWVWGSYSWSQGGDWVRFVQSVCLLRRLHECHFFAGHVSEEFLYLGKLDENIVSRGVIVHPFVFLQTCAFPTYTNPSLNDGEVRAILSVPIDYLLRQRSDIKSTLIHFPMLANHLWLSKLFNLYRKLLQLCGNSQVYSFFLWVEHSCIPKSCSGLTICASEEQTITRTGPICTMGAYPSNHHEFICHYKSPSCVYWWIPAHVWHHWELCLAFPIACKMDAKIIVKLDAHVKGKFDKTKLQIVAQTEIFIFLPYSSSLHTSNLVFCACNIRRIVAKSTDRWNKGCKNKNSVE